MAQLKLVMQAKRLRNIQLAKYRKEMKIYRRRKARRLPAKLPEKVVDKNSYINRVKKSLNKKFAVAKQTLRMSLNRNGRIALRSNVKMHKPNFLFELGKRRLLVENYA